MLEKLPYIEKPKDLPDSYIIYNLINKSNSLKNSEIHYINELERFRQTIVPQLSQINLLFPEYTPHDEKYHIKKLFPICDDLLGKKVIDHMNATELFLLSLSLYGHDWGMAVSNEEKKFILSNEVTNNKSNLLDNEKIRFKEFCKANFIKDPYKVSNEKWREYVRKTHAARSAKRIRDYFENINLGVADYAARICEGHYLDFVEIDKEQKYPTNSSINREIVNVKALTIYIRLIDLLDLGEDRTPYILWKFVQPENEYSKMEWRKHRALHPVTFPNYQSGRNILVEGSTDDHNVYYSLLDLKNYIDEQFRYCSDILNRMNHEYHRLDIYHIDWRIAARGFEPIAVQFEFDRLRMFEILADEIYEGDVYVFLRELLQNSIDAIRLRKEILSRKDPDTKILGKISVKVVNFDDYYLITFKDNGIGMDEYIIRNYLSIAGKSYYKSSDFEKESLKIDPISRFGIGILSCFMVADSIEIRTRRDPNFANNSQALKVLIPSKEKHFRIEKISEEFISGTEIDIIVIKKKLFKKNNSQKNIEFNVTTYLSKVAGFVDIPIFVEENNNLAIILHPNAKNEEFEKSLKYSLDYSFPFEKAFLPHHVETVKKYFYPRYFKLKEDLGLHEYEGTLCFLVPYEDNIDVKADENSWPTREVSVVDYNNKLAKTHVIRWHDQWSRYLDLSNYEIDEGDLKNEKEKAYKIFLNGIYLSNITPPQISLYEKDFNYHFYNKLFIIPYIVVNIPKTENMKIDLARTNIEGKIRWDIPIWEAFFNFMKLEINAKINTLTLNEIFILLGRYITFYKIPLKIIIGDFIPKNKYPIPFIKSGPNLFFKSYLEVHSKEIIRIPRFSGHFFVKFLESNFISNISVNKIIDLWNGEECFVSYSEYDKFNSSSIENVLNVTNIFLEKNFSLSHIQFVSSPKGKIFPLVQEVYNPKNLSKKSDNVVNIKQERIDSAIKFLENKSFKNIRFVKFNSPFEDKLLYGFLYMNINHLFCQKFLETFGTLKEIEEQEKTDSITIAKAKDKFFDIPFIFNSFYQEKITINELNNFIFEMYNFFIEKRIIEKFDFEQYAITLDNFVSNSIALENEKIHPYEITFDYFDEFNQWGELIN